MKRKAWDARKKLLECIQYQKNASICHIFFGVHWLFQGIFSTTKWSLTRSAHLRCDGDFITFWILIWTIQRSILPRFPLQSSKFQTYGFTISPSVLEGWSTVLLCFSTLLQLRIFPSFPLAQGDVQHRSKKKLRLGGNSQKTKTHKDPLLKRKGSTCKQIWFFVCKNFCV